MKIRVTLLVENEKPISLLGDNPEAKIKQAYELVLALVMTQSPGDKALVEKVEVVEEE